MASIIERNGRFCVVYLHYDENGKRHQKWETYKTMAEAKARKNEVEYRQELGSFDIPICRTISELMTEYVNLYGKTTWTLSTYSSNTGLIRNYILPFLGKLKLIEVTPRVMEKYYQQLLKTPAVPRKSDRKGKKQERYCTTSTVRKVHNLLRSAFKQAEKWELIERNPVELATVPKNEPKKRDIWDAQTLQKALECCNDERLKLCLNLAFACSLRLGELLGLTWDCVDISEEAMLAGNPSIRITKELQRISKKAADVLEQKDILTVFPEHVANNKTILILKKPKTISSVRKVFLPKAVAEMLQRWKMEQDSEKDILGEEYHDYNLVITNPFGTPTESSRIRDGMQQLIKENHLPPVVFHSLRHSSITYKLKLNGGDIKAVQGDSGHSQATMVTDQYSHILDESRVANAQLIQGAFYEGKSLDELHGASKGDNRMTEQAAAAGIDPEMLIKILGNPEMVNMIKMLSKAVGEKE